MKNFLDKIINLLPYAILAILVGTFLIFFYQNDITYTHFIGTIQILIWPVVVFFTFLFFRKIFTYLFLSVQEFNFFGAKGTLRDVKEVIEERVQMRIKERDEQEKRASELSKISDDFENVKNSKVAADKKATEYLELAKDVFGRYQKLSSEHEKTIKELDTLRQEKIQREARIASFRESVKMRRNSRYLHHERSEDLLKEEVNTPKAPPPTKG